LWAIHTANDPMDDRPHDLLDASQSKVRRLLHYKTWLGEFERFHEVIFHATVSKLYYKTRESVPMLGGILSLLKTAE
jgi:hypothetical protein